MNIKGHITYKATFSVDVNMKKEEFEQLPPSKQQLLIEGAIDPNTVDYYDAEIHERLEY